MYIHVHVQHASIRDDLITRTIMCIHIHACPGRVVINHMNIMYMYCTLIVAAFIAVLYSHSQWTSRQCWNHVKYIYNII